MANNTNSTNAKEQFYKNKHKEEMKYQVFTFALMIAFTLIAFGLVIADVAPGFTIPTILVLAAVQVLFQFYYFMHMKDKDHEMPAMMIYSGIFAAILTVLALSTIVWW